MIVDIGKQADLFLISFYFGIFTALLFDIFRVLRKTFAHKNFLVQIEDLLFWLIVTFLFYYIFLHRNNGEIRFYLLLGFLLGFLLFLLTISKFFIKYLSKFVFFIKKVISKIFNFLLQPVTFLCKIVTKRLYYSAKKTRNIYKLVSKKKFKKNKRG